MNTAQIRLLEGVRLARASLYMVCDCRCHCTCRPDDDMRRVVEAGMPLEVAYALAQARSAWRQMERDGAPDGWPPGSRHYLLTPVSEDDDTLNRIYWHDAETAAQHPLAETFDALWLRQFRKVRGIR